MKLIVIALFICLVIVVDLQEGWALPAYRKLIGTPMMIITIILQLLVLILVVYILTIEISNILKAISILISMVIVILIPKCFIHIRNKGAV